MAVEYTQAVKITLPASAHLSQAAYNADFGSSDPVQYTFVAVNSSGQADLLASATDAVVGVLQNKPYVKALAGSQVAGIACEITVVGLTKVVAETAISPGGYIAPIYFAPSGSGASYVTNEDGQAQSCTLAGYGTGFVQGTKKAVGLLFPLNGSTAAADGDVTSAIVNCLNPIPAT